MRKFIKQYEDIKLNNMKIAMLASNFIRIPPEPAFVPSGQSGATEEIVYLLTEGLVNRGHDVTLFSSGDSKSSAHIESIFPKCTAVTKWANNMEYIMNQEFILIQKAYKLVKERKFDLVHSHIASRTAFFAGSEAIPTVATLHRALHGVAGNLLSYYPKSQYYVSISNQQRVLVPNLNYIATIYHGLEEQKIPFIKSNNREYMIFVGRLNKEKGVLEAVELAKSLKKKLLILGTIPEGSDFFNKKVRHYVDNSNIIFIEKFLSKKKLYDYVGKAFCFLFPLQWEEPFGLVLIEAMACGTPVIAYARGAIPEIIKDGETGFIINPSEKDKRGNFIVKKTGQAGFVEAINKIYNMSPEEYEVMRCASRAHVENSFTDEAMVKEYIKVYQKVLARN